MSNVTLKAHSNQMVEWSFQSTKNNENPFKNIVLDVIFTLPTNEKITIPAFWAGGQRWCVRYASPLVGLHTFFTHCNDAKNAGLHAQQGQVDITSYAGENPLYKHGALRVAPDQRHFEHHDGTPFFWLADTWWMALCKRLTWPQDFQTLAANRKQKGFNVIQLVAGLYPDMAAFDARGASESGFSWEADFSQINPAFFDEADQKIAHLIEQGLVPCIIGAWGYYLPRMGLEKMQLHWRYLMARWGAYPVVWVAAGEQTMAWYLESAQQKTALEIAQKNAWSDVLTQMHLCNGFKRLITTHPVTSARASVNNPQLLDFEMQQTNHRGATQHHALCAAQGWQALPTMPVISAEARYEGLEISPTVTAKNVREAFWAHTLNSGCAGHSYGANGIWQVNQKDQPFGRSPSGFNWGTLPWQQAMHLPAATQCGLAKAFLLTLPWQNFQALPLKINAFERFYLQFPRIKKICTRLGFAGFTATPIAACINKEATVALFYTVTTASFKINLAMFNTAVFAYWVDPSHGLKTRISPKALTQNGFYHAKPPKKNAVGDHDWVLLLCEKVC